VDSTPEELEYASRRRLMVDDQLRRRGITDERLLEAMARVPRHLFLAPGQRAHAYDDGPLPIGSDQTISQPYMVARMTELLLLDKGSRVLEIGTGSGYQAAILAELAAEVFSVERLPKLKSRAEGLLHDLGYYNVHVVQGDGTLGWSQAAPYDAIVVTAGAPRVPAELRKQLRVGGKMVIPVTEAASETLLFVEKLAECDTEESPATSRGQEPAYRETAILACTFVPLIGQDGYDS